MPLGLDIQSSRFPVGGLSPGAVDPAVIESYLILFAASDLASGKGYNCGFRLAIDEIIKFI